MYRSKFASLRIPDVSDTDQARALQELSSDIQYLTQRNVDRLNELKRRRGALLQASTVAGAIPNMSLTTIQWDFSSYDTDGYFNPLVSTTNLNVPPGVFLVSTWFYPIPTSGGAKIVYIETYGSVSGIVAKNQVEFSSALGAELSATGLTWSPAGETMTLRVIQGSGSTLSTYYATMAVAKIGNL